MARHNIYIREENEEAWMQSSKSEFINNHLARIQIGNNSSEFNPYAIMTADMKPQELARMAKTKMALDKKKEVIYEPIDT